MTCELRPAHLAQALKAIVLRELFKFSRQYGRLASALVRPLLWLAVFAAGFRSVFGVAIVEPYDTYISYDIYIVPGLIGMVLLFNGMQSSLAMVYDREMGLMRLLLTAPLPRWWVLACKLLATTVLSLLQALAFVIVAALLGTSLPWLGAHSLNILLATAGAALMLSSSRCTSCPPRCTRCGSLKNRALSGSTRLRALTPLPMRWSGCVLPFTIKTLAYRRGSLWGPL